MAWQLKERKIGRAGGLKQRLARQKEWDKKYGEGNWEIGYVIDNEFISQEGAFESIYYQSYVEHFENHPEDLTELIQIAKKLRNPHAEATTGVDLQVPAIMQYLEKHNSQLQGNEIVDIGSWEGQASHKISIRLSPLHLKLAGNPSLTLEKILARQEMLGDLD